MEKDALRKMNENYERYTETEHRIYAFIRNNLNKVPNMTIDELARLTDTSASAITRFVQKNGYKGFVDFRIDLSRYLAQHSIVDPVSLFDEKGGKQIPQKLYNYASVAVQTALEVDNQTAIDQLVDTMIQEKMFFVYGTGLSRLAAESFYQKGVRLGLCVHFVEELSAAKYMMASNPENVCLIAISNSGLSENVRDMVEFANKKNIQTVSITRSGKNPVSLLSDIHISNGATAIDTSAMNAYVYAQLILIDMIFILYAQKTKITEQLSSWWIKE